MIKTWKVVGAVSFKIKSITFLMTLLEVSMKAHAMNARTVMNQLSVNTGLR